MTAQELYNYITEVMTPEQALLKLLEGQIIEYEKLKFSDEGAIHPTLLIATAAMEMGWFIAIRGGDNDELNGMAVGTKEYIDELFDETHECCGNCK